VTGVDGGGSVRVGGHPYQFRVDLIGAGLGRRDAMIYIYF
jgi:hypothetical protein